MNVRPTIKCQCGITQFEKRIDGILQPCVRCKQDMTDPLVPEIEAPSPLINWGGRIGPIRADVAIKKFRVQANLSQSQVAKSMRVPRTYISKLENNHAVPTLGSLDKLAVALNVPPWEILKEMYA